jgi:transcriptional regulator with XRE-family HTH domain
MPKIFDNEALKRRIGEVRKWKSLNQAQLADLAGVTPAAISQIEKGLRVPTIPVLHRIANVLGVSLDYLTGKTDKVELEDLLQQDTVKEFFRGFQSLDPGDQETIIKNIEFLKLQSMEKKGDAGG